MSTKGLHRGAVIFGATALLAALPAAGQPYNYFPGGATTNDGRTVALAGSNVETLAQDFMTFIIAVPPGETEFEIGIFDGETGGTSAGGRHWDSGTTSLRYSLFYDPLQQGSTAPGNLVGTWLGNSTSNPTSSPGVWTASSASFPDNGWWDLTVTVPEPPEPTPGEAPSGASFYHLCVSYTSHTGDGQPDPCTGDARPADASPSTISNFKLRATANISVLSFAFAYEGALRPVGGQEDIFLIYPTYSPPVPNDFFLTAPTTYDGTWSFNLDVATSQTRLDLFGGDFDFGTDLLVGFPSGAVLDPCFDTDDPDTPNSALYPPFAVDMGGTRLDDSLPEDARLAGSPPDDNRFDVFRRSPCIHWTLTSPGADGDLSTPGDNVVYANDNPSSQREWEKFTISSEPDCDTSPLCDPLSDNCADYCESDPLPAGTWRIDISGVDLSNLNAWRSLQPNSFCLNCVLPRPYLVGDTVWSDLDGDGFQDPDEPGIPGVLVELLDESGALLDTRITGDSSSGYGPGEWEACVARNTGGGTVVDTNGLYCFDVSVPNEDPDGVDTQDYSVRVASSSFAPGGGLFDHFGTSPAATTESPTQMHTVVEGGGNVMTYDFGYVVLEECGPCEGKVSSLTLLYLGDAPATVVVTGRRGKIKDDPLFSGVVAPGGEIVIVGPPTGSGGFAGTLGTEIDVSVNGAPHVTIHTSCSQPIGPGMVFGDFVVTAGESSEGGPLCPADPPPSDPPEDPVEDCGCEGKVTDLTLRYQGAVGAQVRIDMRKGDTVFDGFVAPGGTLTVTGADKQGTLGPEVDIFLNGQPHTSIHTSCSQPIGPGLVRGLFEVIEGVSRNGGDLCPVS